MNKGAGATSPRRAKKKNRKKRVGKPNRFLWALAMLFLRPWYRLRYGLRIDRTGLAGLKGPALVLAPHISGKDHVLVGVTLSKYRPTFVLSAHFMAYPQLRWALRRIHVITKKMFCSDAHTIMDILRAKNEGNVIVLFPEGRLPACGHSMPLTAGTAELVKKLGIDVYTVTGNGAYLTFPKWAKKPRRGKIRVSTAKIFDSAELPELDVAQIEQRLGAAMAHDDEAAMAGVTYRCKDMTAGLDGILRRCPVCGAQGSLQTRGGRIRCACGLDAVLDRTYRLHGAPFGSINEWFDWQQAQIDPYRTAMDSEVTVGAINGRGNLVRRAGEGRAHMDAEKFSFTGQVFGREVSFSVATEKLGGLPVTVAKHFDIYSGNILYHLYPKPDPRAAIDWVCYLDRLHELQGQRGTETPEIQAESPAGGTAGAVPTLSEENTEQKTTGTAEAPAGCAPAEVLANTMRRENQ